MRRSLHFKCIRFVVGAIVLGAMVSPTLAHDVLADYTRHDLSIRVAPRDIEIEADVTFYMMYALRERHRMDANHDNVIGSQDIERYVAELRESLEDALELSIGGRHVELFSLYDPSVNLRDVRSVGAAPLSLHLTFFARTPSWLKAGDEIVIGDRLWPNLPAITDLAAEGSDGFRVLPIRDEEHIGGAAAGLRFRARCVAVPSPSVGAPPPARASAASTSSWMVIIGATWFGFVMAGGAALRRHRISGEHQ